LKRSKGEKIFGVFNTIMLLIVVLVCFYPIYYVMVASVSNASRLAANTGALYKPLGFSLDAYKRVFDNPSIRNSYTNTIFYVILGTFINIVMSSIGAYVLSLRHLKINAFLNKMVIFTMFFSGGLIPLFLQVRNMGMLNTVWALVIPTAINTYNMLLMRTAFEAVPASLLESAKVDGASDIRILVQIVLPLSKPILATMVLYYGVANWNAWFNAMVYLRTRALYPVQLILREILITSNLSAMAADVSTADLIDIGQTIQYATIIVVTLPILLVYPFLQRYFVKGLTAGAVKG
jgi:ABC-type sugar transport system, permease component